MFEVCGIRGELWKDLISIPRRLFKDTLPLYRIIILCRCRICGLPGSAVAKLNRPLNLSDCCNFKHLHWTAKATYGLVLIEQPPLAPNHATTLGAQPSSTVPLPLSPFRPLSTPDSGISHLSSAPSSPRLNLASHPSISLYALIKMHSTYKCSPLAYTLQPYSSRPSTSVPSGASWTT